MFLIFEILENFIFQILEMLETYSKIIVKITFRLCQLKLSPTLEYLKCNYIIKYIQSFVIMPLNS